MERTKLLWLREQLEIWEKEGIITKQNKTDIRNYCGKIPLKKTPTLKRLSLILGGISLILLGCFLLLAGFWHSFSPNGRFDIILVMLTVVLGIESLALWQTKPGSTIRDIASIMYMVVMLSATYLMSDVYPLGDINGVGILITIVLSIFTGYFMKSAYVVGFSLLLSILWCTTSTAYLYGAKLVWLLILLALPFYKNMLKDDTYTSNSKIFVSWSLVMAVFFSFFFTLQTTGASINILLLTNLALITYLLGRISNMHGLWSLPFRSIGIAGLLYVIFVGTFSGTWSDIASLMTIHAVDYLLAFSSLGIIGYLIFIVCRQKLYLDIFIAGFAPIMGLCTIMACYQIMPLVITVLLNIYTLVVAALFVLAGIWQHKSSMINLPIIVLVDMILARFFDPSFTFLERGISFITVGLLVLIGNIIYLWNKNNTDQKFNREVKKRPLKTKNIPTTTESEQNIDIIDNDSIDNNKAGKETIDE